MAGGDSVDRRYHYDVNACGFGHPTLSDNINLLTLLAHDEDGSHKADCINMVHISLSAPASEDVHPLRKKEFDDSFPLGCKMYFYQNTAPPGWVIDTSVADCLLAVKGGTQAYNVTGGTLAGTWTQPNHTHTGPSHLHQWHITVAGTATNNKSYNINGNATDLWAYAKDTGAKCLMATSNSGDFWAVGENEYTSLAGTAATGDRATANTWRVLGAVGIIATKA